MKEEEKLKGWLAKSLPENELKAFEKSNAFGAFYKISETAKQYKAPDYDTQSSFNNLLNNLPKNQTTPFPFLRILRNIAAILILGVGMFFLFKNNTNDIALSTLSEQEQLFLPDTSKVIVNANSTLSYNKSTWDTNRNIELKGEAFFKVAKGETFKVKTARGTVTVLGTEFTVKDTKNSFEVSCYEGIVSVSVNDENYKLLAGNGLKFTNGTVEKTVSEALTPAWIKTNSVFKSTSLADVLTALEKAYNITTNPNNTDTTVLFTGSFTHKNLTEALQSITVPLGLSFEIDGTTVNFKN